MWPPEVIIERLSKVLLLWCDLTKQDLTFILDDKCQEAFDQLKVALTGPEVMGYPLNEGGEFKLDVDASGVGIGAVL